MLNKQLLFCLILTLGVASGCAKSTETTSDAKSAPADDETVMTEEEEHSEDAPPKLSAEDQALVEAQIFCPVGGKLGGMGTPVKVMVEGKPVFICCEGCREPLLENPEKYLAELEEKKKEAAAKEAEESESSESEGASS